MNRNIARTLLREIWKNKSRFISILLIVFIGVGFFGGIKASGPDMQISADQYFDQNNLMDFRVISTFGFDKNDLDGLRMLNGVEMYPSYFADYYVQYESENITARVFSLENYGNQSVNKVILTEGRMPSNPNECIVDTGTMQYDIPLNTVITLSEDDEDSNIEDNLANVQYTVVGKFISPMYVEATGRGKTTIGTGTINTVIYIPEENFVSEYHTEVYLRFSSLKNLNCYSDEYKTTANSIQRQIEQCADNREMNRYQQLYDEAKEKIDEAQAKLEKQLKKQKKKLKKSKETLNTAKMEIESGKAELEAAQIELDAQFELAGNGEYEPNIDNEIDTSEIDSLRDKIENSEKLYENLSGESIGDINHDQEQVDDEYAEKDEAEEISTESDTEDDITPDDGDAITDGDDAIIDVDETEYLDFSDLDLENPTEETLKEMKQIILDARKELIEAEEKLNQAVDSIPDQYEGGTEDVLTELSAQQEVLDAQRDQLDVLEQEYEEGLANYKKGKEKFNQTVKEAKQKIRKQEKKLEELKEPEWYIYSREDNPGYSEYRENAERINNIGKVFPVFFLLVAALVCLTCMSRMIDEERTQIGTLKALGYSNRVILSRYMIYALLATLIGAVLGLAAGFQLFPRVIIYSYSMMYRIPVQITPFHWNLAIASVLSAVICVAVTVGYCCSSILREQSAELMRPKAPVIGKRVLLERIPFIWRRMSFSQKVTARNIFRYKKRMLMTIVGIAGCTALTLTGFGLKDSIQDIVKLQYGEIWKYDAMINLDQDATEEDTTSVVNSLTTFDPGASALTAMMQSVEVKNNNETLTSYLMVPENENILDQFVELRSRKENSRYTLLDDGVMITEKAAELLHLSVGDELQIEWNKVDYKATVKGIVENYTNHYIYMAPSLFMDTFADVPQYNTVLAKYDQMDAQQEYFLNGVWLQEPSVLRINYSKDVADKFSDIMNILNVVILVLIISAGALALVVLYNLSSINITERKREIATLKVLGFNNRETTGYIFKENLFMALIGILLGFGFGRILTYYVVTVAEIDVAMFGRTIYPESYGMAMLVTLGFFLLVTVIMSFALRKIDMVESLKSVE